MLPRVSVIIPSFNSVQYLADAVKSVNAQTYSAVECIVIDDGSTDRTTALLEDLSTLYPGLRMLRKANGGPSSARNMGLSHCTGQFVSFLDADDLLLPNKIERQVAFLNAHPDIGFVYGDYLVVAENLREMALFTAEMPRELDPVEAFCYRNWFNPLAPLIRRTVVDGVGWFNEELKSAEDWDYWIRCAKVARLAYLAGPVGLYRQHGGQIHRDSLRMRRACIEVAMKHFCNNRKRLWTAMAAIELTHGRNLWRRHERAAAFVSLMKFGTMALFGLDIRRQLEIVGRAQLKPIGQGNLETIP
jgi:glycosyltransferase involved in cell wall biosynthesis